MILAIYQLFYISLEPNIAQYCIFQQGIIYNNIEHKMHMTHVVLDSIQSDMLICHLRMKENKQKKK